MAKEFSLIGSLSAYSKRSSIVLDCGEGSHAQLMRLYGGNAHEVFRTIDAIYVSHIHGDHHLGLVDMIRERAKAFKGNKLKPLVLFAPEALRAWLEYTRKYLLQDVQIMFVPLNALVSDSISSPRKRIY